MKYEPIYKDFWEQLPHPNSLFPEEREQNQNPPDPLYQGGSSRKSNDLFF
ncbi:MAG: hypothetical protein LBQ24_03170 [Candidatus Peribacteria bacterium]|nr:hypothetical protein [Candidatus Peribacteria bacterium]